MNEDTQPAPETEEEVYSSASVTDLPECDAPESDMPELPAARPADVPEKFWDDEAGAIRTESLLKSYQELERKLGGMLSLPEDPDETLADPRVRRALGVPDTADDYQIEARGDLLETDPAINDKLHAAGFTQKQAQLVYDMAAEHILPLVHDMAAEVEHAAADQQLRGHFGGDAGWKEAARQIGAWGRANLSSDVFETLSSRVDGVLAIHKMMQGEEPDLVRRDGGQNSAPDEAGLRRMMRDPRYWRDRDPGFIAQVTEGFKRLYST
jgi:hypothetical protein